MAAMRALAATCAALAVAGASAGCALTSKSLMSEHTPTVQLQDPTSFEPLERLPFAVSDDRQVRVHLHVGAVRLMGTEYTRVALVFANRGTAPVTLRPRIGLAGRDGMPIRPLSADAVQHLAAALLRRPVPALPAEQADGLYNVAVANVEPPRRSEPSRSAEPLTNTAAELSAAVQQGVAAVESAVQSAVNQDHGEALIVWVDRSFLKKDYTLPAGASAAGGLLLRIDDAQRPLSATVETGVSTHTFLGLADGS